MCAMPRSNEIPVRTFVQARHAGPNGPRPAVARRGGGPPCDAGVVLTWPRSVPTPAAKAGRQTRSAATTMSIGDPDRQLVILSYVRSPHLRHANRGRPWGRPQLLTCSLTGDGGAQPPASKTVFQHRGPGRPCELSENPAEIGDVAPGTITAQHRNPRQPNPARATNRATRRLAREAQPAIEVRKRQREVEARQRQHALGVRAGDPYAARLAVEQRGRHGGLFQQHIGAQ